MWIGRLRMFAGRRGCAVAGENRCGAACVVCDDGRRSPGCGARVVCAQLRSWVIPRERSPPRTSPADCRWRTPRLVVAVRSRALGEYRRQGRDGVGRARPRRGWQERAMGGGAGRDRGGQRPASTVVSGEPEALHELRSKCEQEGSARARSRWPDAAHSPQMEAICASACSKLLSDRPRTPATCRSTRRSAVGSLTRARLDADYWYRNPREPVRVRAGDSRSARRGPPDVRRDQPPPGADGSDRRNR